MRNLFIFFIINLIFISPSFAYEMVLPKEKNSISNTQYAFFVGKANSNENISINDERIYIAPNGAFAHSVKLKNGENRIIYVQPSAMLQKTQGEWFDNDILASFDIASNLNKKNYKATYLYKAHYYRDKRVESDSVTWFYRYFISFYKVNADYVTNDEIDIRIEATKSYEFYLTIGTNAIYNIGDYEATVEVEPSINLTVENTGTAAVYLTKQKLVGMCGRSRSQEIGAIVDIGYHVGKLAASVYTNGLLGYGSALKLYNLLSTTTTASADKEKDLYGWIYITRNGKYGYSTGISGGYNISRTGQHLTLMVCGMGNGQLHLSNGTMQVKIRI